MNVFSMSGGRSLPSAYSSLPSSSRHADRRESADSAEDSADSLRTLNTQMKQEGRVAQSFLEEKWASMRKTMKKSKKEKKRSSRESGKKHHKHRHHREEDDDEEEERHGRRRDGHDERRHRHQEDGSGSGHRRSHHEAFGEHDDRTAEHRRPRHHDAHREGEQRRRRSDDRRYERDDRRRDDSRNDRQDGANRRGYVPCLLANVSADGNRPAYLTDEVIWHAEEIQRRRKVWQRGREREAREKKREEEKILEKIRDGEPVVTAKRVGIPLNLTYTTGEEKCNPKATSTVPVAGTSTDPSDAAALKWTAMSASVAGGAAQQDKFRKLMGIKTEVGPKPKPSTDEKAAQRNAQLAATVETNKQNYVLSSLEDQYSAGRRTQMYRGTGLGFASASSWMGRSTGGGR